MQNDVWIDNQAPDGMIKCNTKGATMSTVKIAITIEDSTLRELDGLVENEVFSNRSKAIQQAVQEKLDRLRKTRLARECAKADVAYEQALADEGMEQELETWPEY